MSSEPFLDAATAIGRQIAAQALWHAGRCTWMGAAVEPADPSRPEYRPLGPELYVGTAGVGLFLAQLAALSGEPSLRRTAAGALRHAVERAPGLPAGERDGLYTGALGIAAAAVRGAALLGTEQPVEDARGLPAKARTPPDCPDLFVGAAGSAAGLLRLGEALGEPSLRDAAIRLGEHLLARATVTRPGWSWRNPEVPSRRHLCGLAHGAAGIGWAFVELCAATGDQRFRAAAEGAFAYERSRLEGATWPDLRRGVAPDGMVATWCTGEAGIALSRLRAAAVLGDGPHRLDADVAIAAMRRHLLARLPYALDDLSLCHGAGGTALALLAAGERDAASALGEVALDRYGRSGRWPCGVLGTTPGLFRGLAGIGWLFLCLHDPDIPSPLRLLEPG